MRYLLPEFNEIVNESTFYGKNNHLTRLEGYVDQLKIAMSNMDGKSIYSEILPAMERTLADLFGFETVFLTITDRGTHTIPAFVSVKSIIPFNPQFKAIKGKYGPTFLKTHGLKTYINLGFELFSAELTPSEITAVILHEVGHSFAFTTKNRIMMLLPDFIVASIIMTVFKSASKNLADFLKVINAYNLPLQKFTVLIKTIFSNILSLAHLIPFSSLLTLGEAMTSILYNPLKLMVPFFKNDDEIFSDAFATSFGYGAELNSALSKMRGEDFASNIITNNLGNNNFVAWIYAFNIYVTSLTMLMLSPHPSDYDRIQNTRKYLEQSLKDEKNIKLKAEMNRQLKAIDSLETVVITDSKSGIIVNDLAKNNQAFIDIRTILSEYNDGNYTNLDFKK